MGGILDVFTAPITTVSSALTNAWNDYTGKTATEMSINAAKKNTAQQIAWERERATHAHQWEIEDLEKAGLNPILSAGGSGSQTGGISPQMPDFSKYKGTGGALLDLAMTSQQIKNDTDRVLNETKETNSNLSLKRSQVELNLEKKLNFAVERGWISQKTATEIKNRAKIQSDMELANSQIMMNEQLRDRMSIESKKLEKEIELLKEDIKNAPNRRKAQKLANDLTEKENQIFYVRETINELTRLGGMGLSLYGTYQANKAISAYKANQNRTSITNSYDKYGRLRGTREQFYK